MSAAESAVASPCINVCKMSEAAGVCEGCLRTLDEIAAWGSLDDAAKLQVWRQIRVRRQDRRDDARRRRQEGGAGPAAGQPDGD